MRRPKRFGRRRAVADGALAAYAEWRQECAAVWRAHRRWVGASAAEKTVAFHAYAVALEREEEAASRYADLLPRGTAEQRTESPPPSPVPGPGESPLMRRNAC